MAEQILTGDTINEGRIKINHAFSAQTDLWTGGTGSDSIIANNATGNEATGVYSVALGDNSKVFSSRSIICGGENNVCSGNTSFIGGGSSNFVQNSVNTAFVGGGDSNSAMTDNSVVCGGEDNVVNGDNSFLGGGLRNDCSGLRTTLVGGVDNICSGVDAFVGGGDANICTGGESAIVGGGDNVCSGGESFIGCGDSNICSGDSSVIVGGQINLCHANESFVGGGYYNTAVTGFDTIVICGGKHNIVSADTGSILGGSNNLVDAEFGTVLGGKGNRAGSDGDVDVGMAFGGGAQTRATFDFILGATDTTNPSVNNNTIRFQGTGGNIKIDGTVTSPESDYAEYFEWLDGNPTPEDRKGLFVCLSGENIYIGNTDVLGVISAKPSLVGDAQDNHWKDMYLRDDWNLILYEEYDYYKFTDGGTKLKIYENSGGTKYLEYPNPSNVSGITYVGSIPPSATTGTFSVPTINPSFDPSLEYIPREERDEWSPVGLLGKLMVRTAEAITGTHVDADSNGMAVNGSTYPVLKTVRAYGAPYGIVQVLFK
jgi:hypothetical protein